MPFPRLSLTYLLHSFGPEGSWLTLRNALGLRDPVRLVHRDIAAYLVAQGHAKYLDHPDNLDGQVECAMLAPSRNAMRPRPRPRLRVVK